MTHLTPMTRDQLLTSLRETRVDLWREGDQLRYRAEAGMLTAELLQQLLEQKSEIPQVFEASRGFGAAATAAASGPAGPEFAAVLRTAKAVVS